MGLLAADLQTGATQSPSPQNQAEAASSLPADLQVLIRPVLADDLCFNSLTKSLVACPAVSGPNTSTTQPPTSITVSTTQPPKTTTTIKPKAFPEGSQTSSAELNSGLAQATAPVRKYLGCISLAESTNRPTAYSSVGPYYGKYQFLQSTWDNFVISIGFDKLAHVDIRQIPEPVQDYIALRFYLAGRRGEWGPNRSCAYFLQAG